MISALVVARFRPAHIHAHQHLRPILALGAARAGMDLDIGIVARRPRPTAAPRPRACAPLASAGAEPSRPRRRRCRPPPPRRGRPARHYRRVRGSERSKAASEASSCWRSRIRLCARRLSLQKSGASASRSSAVSLVLAWSGSKMPPEQGQGLSDIVDDRTRFRRASFPRARYMDGTAVRPRCRRPTRFDRI